MKTCPVCALNVEDTYLFCPDDGLRLSSTEASSMDRPAGPPEADSRVDNNENAGAVVLYCPTCAAEYPLTFSECPTHGVKLTRHNISRQTDRPAAILPESDLIRDKAAASDLPKSVETKPIRTAQLLTLPIGLGPALDAAAVSQVVDRPLRSTVRITAQEPPGKPASTEPLTEPEQRFERPGYRVAAISTMIALAVFAVVGIYAFVSGVSRRPSAPVMRTAEAITEPFIPTPQEAQDYKEEQPAQVNPKVPETQPDRTAEQKEPVSAQTSERKSQSRANEKSDLRTVAEPRSESVNSPVKASLPPMPTLPRGNSGGFDARLIRVRSNRTSSGFRYDLTFNIQEQAGRSAQWQRVLVTTRSVSGANRSQAIPFAHRLGAAGALTFTISVALDGRSEADWQGRVVCTTLGWDNRGAPLQASFGANLMP